MTKPLKIVKHQQWHLLILIALLFLLQSFSKMDATFLEGAFYGIKTQYWCLFALSSAILHQFYVLVCWRSELYYKSLTNLFGEQAFKRYKLGFALLILSRPVTITFLAISNAQTIEMNTSVSYVLSGSLFLPVLYLFYSVRIYFGIDRAFGIDHFDPETYKQIPMVKQGIFQYTPNAMYIVGFLALWIPGILLQSKGALVMALFHHIYIWVHYYFTELPDMKTIYGKKQISNQT